MQIKNILCTVQILSYDNLPPRSTFWNINLFLVCYNWKPSLKLHSGLFTTFWTTLTLLLFCWMEDCCSLCDTTWKKQTQMRTKDPTNIFCSLQDCTSWRCSSALCCSKEGWSVFPLVAQHCRPELKKPNQVLLPEAVTFRGRCSWSLASISPDHTLLHYIYQPLQSSTFLLPCIKLCLICVLHHSITIYQNHRSISVSIPLTLNCSTWFVPLISNPVHYGLSQQIS